MAADAPRRAREPETATISCLGSKKTISFLGSNNQSAICTCRVRGRAESQQRRSSWALLARNCQYVGDPRQADEDSRGRLIGRPTAVTGREHSREHAGGPFRCFRLRTPVQTGPNVVFGLDAGPIGARPKARAAACQTRPGRSPAGPRRSRSAVTWVRNPASGSPTQATG